MIRTCSNAECQKIFSTNGIQTLCQKCQGLEEDSYLVIKQYLDEHPGAGIKEVHEATQISMEFIENLYKSGRFSLVVLPKCTRCGKENIGQLNVCQECADSMRNQFSSAMAEIKTPAKAQPQPIRANSSRDSSYGLGRHK